MGYRGQCRKLHILQIKNQIIFNKNHNTLSPSGLQGKDFYDYKYSYTPMGHTYAPILYYTFAQLIIKLHYYKHSHSILIPAQLPTA